MFTKTMMSSTATRCVPLQSPTHSGGVGVSVGVAVDVGAPGVVSTGVAEADGVGVAVAVVVALPVTLGVGLGGRLHTPLATLKTHTRPAAQSAVTKQGWPAPFGGEQLPACP
jgi:hypothetical protein